MIWNCKRLGSLLWKVWWYQCWSMRAVKMELANFEGAVQGSCLVHWKMKLSQTYAKFLHIIAKPFPWQTTLFFLNLSLSDFASRRVNSSLSLFPPAHINVFCSWKGFLVVLQDHPPTFKNGLLISCQKFEHNMEIKYFMQKKDSLLSPKFLEVNFQFNFLLDFETCEFFAKKCKFLHACCNLLF